MGGILAKHAEELGAVGEMTFPDIVESRRGDEVDLGLPFQEQRPVGREAVERFT
jgi:hypothetical protein